MYNTKNDLPQDTREQVCSILQDRLSDVIDLASQVRHAHWTVRGSGFIALHELFDQIHGELSEASDEVAERIMALGGHARGTVRVAARESSLTEYNIEISKSSDHVDALSSALSQFGAFVRTDIDRTSDLGDQGTADLFTALSRQIDKAVWLVEAHQT